jgi:hypothetical protein
MTLIQNRLREQRRSALLESIADSENAYARGEIQRGSAANLLME